MTTTAKLGLLVLHVMATAEAFWSNETVLASVPPLSRRYRNCHELHQSHVCSVDGVYVIYPYDCCPERPVRVWCDMTTDGGGWTVIQRRDDYEDQEDFFRTWTEYVLGFGNVAKDYWLGLDHIHALTSQSLNQIRFDLADFEGESRWAKYDFFYVHDGAASYKLEVKSHSGNAKNSFSNHNGFMFSTKDHDQDIHDQNCAEKFKGAWWYSKCHSSNLNGLYLWGEHKSYGNGVNWKNWHGYYYSLKTVTMKIKPKF
ncbi:techylectin-5A-like [Penaeus japonicus]|uniref:techylectin-5A-like n=1 Tax=Penaeus japonicus TaxID=27405 RepID=UPI001C7103EA|nr:techylectin-5A-like [Penaeus japonicus]XP_042889870.1 techylectin-5A-like [Penaeus japonicus]XP_042889874.1 techylectin-5A-like [Penaeus japonicus]XP_042889883.1 techylectin-5A-like [Penaeus japonicus]